MHDNDRQAADAAAAVVAKIVLASHLHDEWDMGGKIATCEQLSSTYGQKQRKH